MPNVKFRNIQLRALYFLYSPTLERHIRELEYPDRHGVVEPKRQVQGFLVCELSSQRVAVFAYLSFSQAVDMISSVFGCVVVRVECEEHTLSSRKR